MENTIQTTNVQDVYPMSDIQKGMVVTALKNPKKALYHQQFFYQIHKLNEESLNEAVRLMVEKHEILRTNFDLYNYKTEVQIVSKEIDVNIEYINLEEHTTKEQERYIEDYLDAGKKNPFNLSNGPLWRITVFNLASNSVYLLEFHHAILDGWSVASFNTELFHFYTLLEKDETVVLDRLNCTNKDHIKRELHAKKNEKIRQFWKAELDDFSYTDVFENESISLSQNFILNEVVFEKLKSKTNLNGTAVKEICLGAFMYALKMMVYEENILIGIVSNNRPAIQDGDKLLGCFLNSLPFNFHWNVGEELTWKGYFDKISEKSRNIQQNNALTLIEIVRSLGMSMGKGNPFFEILFTYTDFHVYNAIQDNDTATKTDETENLAIVPYAKNESSFSVTISKSNNRVQWVYQLAKPLRNGVDLKKFHRYVEKIIELYLDAPHVSIDTSQVLSHSEQTRVKQSFNNTKTYFPTNKTVVDLFEDQVKETPNNIAVIFNEQQLTYLELNTKVNQLAQYLRTNFEVQQGDLVAIKLGRSKSLIVAILATLKTGAAYVPIDNKYPEQRVAYIKDDSKAKLIINADFLDEFYNNHNQNEEINFESVTTTDDIAYVIYTSGTTGNPKGVPIAHEALHNYINYARKSYVGKKATKTLLCTSISFDLTVTTLFLPLCFGGSIEVIPTKANVIEELKIVSEKEFNFLKLTPSHMEVVLNFYGDENSAEENERVFILGGEELKKETVGRIFDCFGPQTIIWNEYGPTEATVGCVTHKITSENYTMPVTIGKPIANTHIYIVDKEMNMQPIGTPGELLVSGVQVAQGYMNLKEVTEAKFINDPFFKGRRVYKTGDLGYWKEDGNIQYLGRNDNQVKIRGNRIELGEIEDTILSYSEVIQQAVVLVKEKNNDKFLVAYYSQDQEIPLEKKQIQRYLAKQLPNYMVPKFYVSLAEMPLTNNGKINTRLLPEISDESTIRNEYVAPRTKKERQLIQIWKEVLGLDKIGITDNFFELGGDSLVSIKLISKIQARIGKDYQVEDIYNNPTVEEFCSAQKRLNKVFFNQKKDRKTIYFIPGIIGSPIIYGAMAKQFSNDFNCIGLKFPGLDPEVEPLNSIEEIASFFYNEIEEDKNTEDIAVLGFSYGGLIGFEVVKMLEKKYSNVHLYVIDTPVNDGIYDVEATFKGFKEKIDQYCDEGHIGAEQKSHLQNCVWNNLSIKKIYRQRGVVNSKVCIFESTEKTDPTLNFSGWEKFANKGFKMVPIQGNHSQALYEKNFPIYTENINQIL